MNVKRREHIELRLRVLSAVAVALIFGVAVYFRLYDLGGRDLWTDEAWVALAAMQPNAREALAAGQSTPPFYLLSVWTAVQLWGHSEMVLRGLSFAFGVGTLLLIYRVARSLLEVPGALLALAAAAFSPIMVYYSKELKQYSGDAFFAILVVWLAERLRTSQGERGWLALALAGVVGLGFSHALIFTLPIVGAALWALSPRANEPAWRWWGGPGSWPLLLIILCLFDRKWTLNWWRTGHRTFQSSPV